MGRGRALLISYFLSFAARGGTAGDVRLRWIGEPQELPEEALRVDDLAEPATFVLPELVPLLVDVRARLEIFGPHWLPALRRPAITITDTGAWMEFFLAGGRPADRPR